MRRDIQIIMFLLAILAAVVVFYFLLKKPEGAADDCNNFLQPGDCAPCEKKGCQACQNTKGQLTGVKCNGTKTWIKYQN